MIVPYKYRNHTNQTSLIEEVTQPPTENYLLKHSIAASAKFSEPEEGEGHNKVKLGPRKSQVMEESQCKLRQEIIDEIEGYRNVVNKIINFTVSGQFRGRTFDTLAELTDTFGARMVRNSF